MAVESEAQVYHPVAFAAKRDEILGGIISQQAARADVMHHPTECGVLSVAQAKHFILTANHSTC
jgi:hypothetical protein